MSNHHLELGLTNKWYCYVQPDIAQVYTKIIDMDINEVIYLFMDLYFVTYK